jgi:hypothetical protein
MKCSEVLKAHVPPDIKHQVKMAADREFLSEAAWIKRLVVREIRACQGANGDGQQPCRTAGFRRPGREAREKGGCGRPMLVRLRTEDRLLLDARAEVSTIALFDGAPSTLFEGVPSSHSHTL